MADKPLLFLSNQSIGPLFDQVVISASRRSPVYVFRGLLYRRTPVLARLFTWFGFSLQLAWNLLLNGRRFSSLLVVSNPPLAPLLAPLARRPFSLLLYDLYPQVLAQLQPQHPMQRWLLSLVVRLWEQANRIVFARAERVFTLSEAMAGELRPAFASDAIWRSKVVVIPPWADTTHLRPIPPANNPFRRLHGLDGRLLVVYSGNLGFTHPLEPLVEAAGRLKGSVQVLVIGTGPKRGGLEQLACQLKLAPQALRFLDPLSRDQLPFGIAAAALAVVALDGPAAAASLPSKTFTALACGTPLLVLAPLDSALSALVRKHGCGVVVSPGPNAASELVAVITALADDPERRSELAAAALSASHHFTPMNADLLVEEWLSGGSD